MTMEYTVGSLADMISGSSPSKKKKKSKDENVEMKIEYHELPSVNITKKKKESKKRKSNDCESINDSVPKKKKKKVRIALPSEDESTGEGLVIPNNEDNTLDNGAEPEGFNIATLEKQDNNNAKHAKKRLKKKGTLVEEPAQNIRRELDPEQETRTIFVGNLSNKISKFNLANMFRKFGTVESVRLRCAAVADPKTSKRVAIMRKEFHPERSNINAYVRFGSAESAKNALAYNGTVVRDHTIRVDLAGGAQHYNPKNAVFVGNIQFTIEEEELYRLFEPCGKIESVRLIRDNATSMGKGFAYVNFKESQSVELALKLNGEEFGNRPLRVSRCQKKVKGKVKVEKKKSKGSKEGEVKKEKKKKKKPEPGTEFQGQEVENGKVKAKKKKKKNKGELQKKKILGKLHMTPKPQEKKKKVKKSKLRQE